MNEKTNWIRDLLLIPTIVGLVIAALTYGIPKIFEKGKELSYSLDGPTPYFKELELGNISIAINGIPTDKLFVYKVKIRNSGNIPLKDIPVVLSFKVNYRGFQVLNINHTTEPKYEFFKISQQGAIELIRFTYEMLNPDNQDTITLVTNRDPLLEVYSNAEGVRFKQSEFLNQRFFFKWMSIVFAIIGIIGSLLSFFIGRLLYRYIVDRE